MYLMNSYEAKYSLYKVPSRRKKRIFELLPKNLKGMKILDIGCGDGSLWQSKNKTGAIIFGVDLSAKALAKAKKTLFGTKVVDLNKQKLPYKNSSFDIVVATEILEHLVNPKDTLKEIRRVLKLKGILVVTTPNFMYWGNRLKFLKGQFEYKKRGMFDEGHIHFYTYKTLKEDLNKTEFTFKSENHIYLGPKILNPLKKHLPALFAYQFVLMCTN